MTDMQTEYYERNMNFCYEKLILNILLARKNLFLKSFRFYI